MLPPLLLSQLREVLVDLYSDENSARRVVEDAGIDPSRIDFTSSALNIWHAILEEAQKIPAQLDQLFTIVQHEYATNPAWMAVYAAQRAWLTAQTTPGQVEALLNDYLRQILFDTANLVLPIPGGSMGNELTAIYIAPDTHRLTALDDETPADGAGARQSALRFVNDNPVTVLLGEAGAGKTIFANFLALCLAGEHLKQPDVHLTRLGMEWTHGALWPMRIVARAMIPRLDRLLGQGTADLLWAQIVEGVGPHQHVLAYGLVQRIASGGGILIVDGLDEVPEAQQRRAKLQQAIAAFAQHFPHVRILLTSRTYTYQQPQWRLPGFVEAIIAPFSPTQIASYLSQWGWDGPASQPRQSLQQILAENPALQELATRPLLLLLMTVLYATRGDALPTNQAQLLEESICLLLDRWEQAKVRGQAPEPLPIPASQIRATLEAVAYRLHSQQQGPQETGDIDELALANILLRLSNDPDLRPRRVVQYICERIGLLDSRGGGLYGFPHRALQEYLAACCLLSQTDAIPHVAAQLQQAPERWREVVLWAGRKLALTHSAAFWSLVEQLCPADRAGRTDQPWLTMLSGQLLVEAGFTSRAPLADGEVALLERVRQGLVRLFEQPQLSGVDVAAIGVILGNLGDPRPGVGIDPITHLPTLHWLTVEPDPFFLGSEPPFVLCEQIQQPFAISRYPITVAQYQAFVASGGYQQRRWWTADGWLWRRTAKADGPERYEQCWQNSNHPQVGVNWYEAVAFCRWLAVQLGQSISLPSELQWELAARATDGRIYPWGNEFVAAHCNARPTGLGATSAVGIFGRGDATSGAADMAGNVWEWCCTLWVSQLTEYTLELDGDVEASGRRALRGGSFANEPRFVRCANRHRNFPDHRASNVGFRVVLSSNCT